MNRKHCPIPAISGLIAIALAATGVAQQGGRGPQVPPLLLTVNGFSDGAEVPLKYSCSAKPAGVSPAMEWKQVPPGTQSFLVLVHDPEPHPGKGLTDVTHWLIWNIPGTATGLPEGVAAGATLPDGAHQMKRGNGPNAVAGYGGPCAPPGPDHHYTWELWALDTMLDVPADATRADVMKAADGHILGAAEWIGMFHRAPAQ
ncbi:MAG: YbhB/YbcL family Raf kinase inhibitor-like protein [Bryobacteraceae bacterium]|jgi:Raf kinase inhibitor-like YbhB/YbcL family protein